MLTEDAVVCGFINVRVERQLHHEHPVAEICELVVDAAHRGSGCGTYLFDAALDVARNLNCEVIEVDSNNVREPVLRSARHVQDARKAHDARIARVVAQTQTFAAHIQTRVRILVGAFSFLHTL